MAAKRRKTRKKKMKKNLTESRLPPSSGQTPNYSGQDGPASCEKTSIDCVSSKVWRLVTLRFELLSPVALMV
jgi:hypothetical protein